MRTSDVSGVGNSFDGVVFFDLQVYGGAAEHVSCVGEFYADFIVDVETSAVGYTDEELHTLFSMDHIVDGLDEW